MTRLKDDFLESGTNGRLYIDGESDNAPYKVREIVVVTKNQRGGDSKTFMVVQYERGSARLPLDTHLDDVRLPDHLTTRLFSESKFSDESFRVVGM
jgi:hypothetical protein